VSGALNAITSVAMLALLATGLLIWSKRRFRRRPAREAPSPMIEKQAETVQQTGACVVACLTRGQVKRSSCRPADHCTVFDGAPLACLMKYTRVGVGSVRHWRRGVFLTR
jgi:hypothetical protein